MTLFWKNHALQIGLCKCGIVRKGNRAHLSRKGRELFPMRRLHRKQARAVKRRIAYGDSLL